MNLIKNNNSFGEIKKFYPPNKWQKEIKYNEGIDIFKELLNNYSNNDIVANIIKEDGTINILKRNDLEIISTHLAWDLKRIIKNKSKKQIKLFGIIGASEESLIMMLSSAWLGAHHSICFEDLSEDAIQTRIEIFNPDIILCREKFKLKVIKVINNLNRKDLQLRIIDLDELKKSKGNNLFKSEKSTTYQKDSPLFTLYTSGSTGKPKGIVHNARKYFEYANFTTKYFFGINKSSVIFTATDVGWINGHTYAFYGPLSFGCKTIICEDLSKLVNPSLINKLVNDLEITCLYMSVTLLRILKSNSYLVNCSNNNTNKLERIGSCGEPLANEVGKWAINFFKPKRKSIVNTFFQTETGGVLVAPRDEDGIPENYSSVGKPRNELGIFIAKEKMTNEELEKENIERDEILVANPWNGIFQEVLSDREVNYFTFKGFFRLHDIGYFDEKGFLFVGGRSDDVINTAGHRISSSEIESISLAIKEIKESCVVSKPDNVLGEKPILFISIINTEIQNSEILIKRLRNIIQDKLSAYHQPEEINIFQNLPKTKSGKIMRRIMKNLAYEMSIEENKDYSTLANPLEFADSAFTYFKEKVDELSRDKFVLSFISRDYPINLTFYCLTIQIIELINRFEKFENLKHIKIFLENNAFEKIVHEVDLKKSFDLKNINQNLIQSPIDKSIFNVERALIRFSNNKDLDISLILKKISEVKFNFDFVENKPLPKENCCLIEEIIQYLENFNNQDLITSKKKQQDNQNSFETKEKSKSSCFKCMSTIEEMKDQRKSDVYLLTVIRLDGKPAYICDLCAQGW